MAKFLKPLLLFIALQLPSYKVLFKFVPHSFLWLIPVFWIFVFAMYYQFYNRLINKTIQSSTHNFFARILQSYWLAVFLIILLSVVNFFLYPVADALKLQGRGSDQDDAIIVVCKALFSGQSPYDVLTYRGNPPSPGPGLVLLLSPFVLLKIYSLATPFFVAISAFLIWLKTKSLAITNTFLLLLFSAPAFWELTINGADYLMVGCMFFWPLLLYKRGLNKWLKFLFLLFIALLLTSRIIFIYLIPVYAFLLSKIESKNYANTILKVLNISILIAILHLAFYYLDPSHYVPLHIIGKGQKMINILFSGISIIAGLILSTITIRSKKFSAMLILWLWVFVPMLILVLADLNTRGFNWLGYPISYLALSMPLAVMMFLDFGNDADRRV